MKIDNEAQGELFLLLRPMALSIAGKVSGGGVSREELCSEAESQLALLLCEGLSEWREEEGAVTTFVYFKLYWGLREYARTRKRRNADELVSDPPCHRTGWIERMWSELEDEGRKLLRVIFEAPGALGEELWELRPMRCDLPGQRAKVWKRDRDLCWRTRKSDPKRRRAVLEFLLREGWTVKKIERAFAQVQECCA